MTILREQMIQAMRQRGFSPRTHRSYLAAVTDLARFHRCPPDRLEASQLQSYFNHLAQERELSGASCRLFLNGIRFFYLQVLKRPSFDVEVVIPKKAQRIPELLTREDIARIFAACTNPKHRMVLEVTYGCGLRVSEVVGLRVGDIDGERALLRVEQGKGAKDRLVTIGPDLLDTLRRYWTVYRPYHWLFPNVRVPDQALGISTAQRVFTQAKSRAGVTKVGGIHSLRHAYATHQLEQGLAVHALQHLLGHRSLHTTMRYVHWLPGATQSRGAPADLLSTLGSARG